MHDVIIALVQRSQPISQEMWRSLWDRLDRGKLPRDEAVALVSSLSTRRPDDTSLLAFLASLEERREPPAPPSGETVNIVGTGGGPGTFNISTASAFVAATLGARIIKTGSRAFSSRCGSIDLLERLGIPLTTSYAQTDEMLSRFGIACAGNFVYPTELSLLGRRLFPLDMRVLGRFFNAIGPFLASVPTSTQITGVSDPDLVPTLRAVAEHHSGKRVWICNNDTGVDELLSIETNLIHRNQGQGDIHLTPAELDLSPGSLKDLRPADQDAAIVPHFLSLVSGDGPPAAIQSICLNAAALAVASGVADGWREALSMAAYSIEEGAPRRLIDRIRAEARPERRQDLAEAV